MRADKIRVAVLVSGGGTNLQALIDASAAGKMPHAELALVVSNKEGAFALERAARAGITGVTLLKKELGSAEAFEEALMSTLAAHKIDLVVLAGFLAILSEPLGLIF